MSKFLTSLGGGSGVAAAAAVGVVVVGAVAWFQFAARDVETPAALVAPGTSNNTEAAGSDPVDQAVVKPAEQETAPADPSEQAEVPAPAPPTFDEVRREEDGTTVIAGRAAPGALVRILQNGTEIATATADTAGQFATLAFIPPDGKGHVLSLLQMLQGQEVASMDQIILAPLSPPVVVAEVAETPEPTGIAEAAEVDEAADAPTAEVAATPAAEDADAPTTEVAAAPTAEVAATPAAEIADAVETETGTPTIDQRPEPIITTEVAAVEPATETPTTAPAPAAQTAAAEETAVAKADPARTDASPKPQQPRDGGEAIAEPEPPKAASGQPQDTPATEEAPVETASVAEDQMTVRPLPETADDPDPASPTEVAVLKATLEGVELLNPVTPQVMDNVAIDTISYSATGDVQLAGRAQSDARSVRVYLDNDAIVNLSVDAQGRWRGDLPNVDEGIYTLRIDEVDEDGSVTSRVETPFKREAPATLTAASAGQEGPIKAITVQKGATLWAIARERYGSGELYVRVFEANRSAIRDPDLIYPGQIFDLPD